MLCKCSSFYSLFISVIAAGTKLFLKSLVLDLGTENLFPEGRSWLAAELVGYLLLDQFTTWLSDFLFLTERLPNHETKEKHTIDLIKAR